MRIIAIALLLVTSAAHASTLPPGVSRIDVNTPVPEVRHLWKGRFGIVENITKGIQDSYGKKFGLERNPLNDRERQCLLAQSAAALMRVYYGIAVDSNAIPSVLASAENSVNYFQTLARHWCDDPSNRGRKLYNAYHEYSMTNVDADIIKKVVAADTRGRVAKTLLDVAMWQAAWTVSYQLSGIQSMKGALTSDAKPTADKAIQGDSKAKETMTLMGMIALALGGAVLAF